MSYFFLLMVVRSLRQELVSILIYALICFQAGDDNCLVCHKLLLYFDSARHCLLLLSQMFAL